MIKKNLCNLFVLILFLNFSGYGQVTEHYINIKLWVVSNSAGVGLTPTQVENEVIPTVETAFLGLNNATNTFHLNFCAEYFIDDGLHENPNLFKDSECEFLHTPGFMNFLLHDNAERGGCAGSNEGEGDRGFSLRDFQLAHEIGHFLNLYHLNHTCVGNHLDNWQVGDPLGISSSRDFVEDTPFSPIVQVNDTTGEIIFPIYQADGCNVDWSASFSCNDVGYPENYSWEDDGTGQLVYNPVWETNIMVNFWRGGCGHDVNRNFTSGQHDRMRSHILTGNLPYVSMTPKTCPNPVLPLPTSSSVLTPAILNGPQPITGNYVINNDISIASTVIFDVANIEVRNGVKITVAPSGQLDLNSVVFSSLGSCSNAGWQGIEVVDGGKISMDNVEINDAAIGLDLKSRDADLYWAKFINCALGMVAEFGSNNSY